MTHPDQSFARNEHLRDSREFRMLREKGRRVAGQFVIVNALERPEATGRLGVITSRKFGPATARNHARRWLREIYRRHKDQLKSNLSIVVVAREALARASYHEVQTELMKLFGAVGALTHRD
jgi:ribonuclease P protein component